MGYETRIHVLYGVDHPWTYDGKPVLTGVEIASMDLCKCGEGAVSNVIKSFKIDSKEHPTHPLYGLYTRTGDNNQDYVELLREFLEHEKFEEVLRDNNYTKEQFQNLTNNIEDGVRTKDCYDDNIVCVPGVQFLKALKEDYVQEKYRRYEMAIAMLESILKHFPDAKVFTYGH
jgi:hypothetical protein